MEASTDLRDSQYCRSRSLLFRTFENSDTRSSTVTAWPPFLRPIAVARPANPPPIMMIWHTRSCKSKPLGTRFMVEQCSSMLVLCGTERAKKVEGTRRQKSGDACPFKRRIPQDFGIGSAAIVPPSTDANKFDLIYEFRKKVRLFPRGRTAPYH